MTQTLNNAQRKLVEDNHNLIYSYLKSRGLSLDSEQDWYGVAAIGLCKAAMAYDESRNNKFSSLAYVCIENEVRNVMRDGRKDVTPMVSLEDKVSLEDGSHSYADIIPDKRDQLGEICVREAIDNAMQDFDCNVRVIVDSIVNGGLTQQEVADKLGISKQAVSRKYNSFLEKVRRYFDN